MQEFVSEDELPSYEQWLQSQNFVDDPSATEQELLFRACYESMRQAALATPKFGPANLKPKAGEYRYAVAVEEAGRLWIALWVRRSPRGDMYVLTPRADEGWNPHISYHADGRLHMSSFDRKFTVQWRQPPTVEFREFEHLGAIYGQLPTLVGTECDPAAFTAVIKVAPDVFAGPARGGITVDLAAPGVDPPRYTWTNIVARRRFTNFVPHVVLTVGYAQEFLARPQAPAAAATQDEEA